MNRTWASKALIISTCFCFYHASVLGQGDQDEAVASPAADPSATGEAPAGELGQVITPAPEKVSGGGLGSGPEAGIQGAGETGNPGGDPPGSAGEPAQAVPVESPHTLRASGWNTMNPGADGGGIPPIPPAPPEPPEPMGGASLSIDTWEGAASLGAIQRAVAAHRGQPLVVHVFANFSPKTPGELMALQTLYGEYGGAVAVLGVSADGYRGPLTALQIDGLQSTWRRAGVSYGVWIYGGQDFDGLMTWSGATQGVPITIVYGPQGDVWARYQRAIRVQDIRDALEVNGVTPTAR